MSMIDFVGDGAKDVQKRSYNTNPGSQPSGSPNQVTFVGDGDKDVTKSFVPDHPSGGVPSSNEVRFVEDMPGRKGKSGY